MILVLTLLGCTPEATDTATAAEPYPFVPLEGLTALPDVSADRLCPAASTDPDGQPDPIDIDCALEAGLLAPPDPEPVDSLVVLAYNLERGHALDAMIGWLLEAGPAADVILLSEADRGCGRTGGRHVTWELAAALGMDFAYAVEFVEVSGQGEVVSSACEHGNAILSRFPMGNVTAWRHAENVSWYTPPDARGESWSTRLGGRIAVSADVQVGDQLIHFTSVHYASGLSDQDVRASQAAETVAHAAGLPHPVIAGGDMNAGTYVLDLHSGGDIDGVSQAFLQAGYDDAHASLPADERVTAPEYGFVLDLIFGDGVPFSAPGLCDSAPCDGLSDHFPVWTTAAIP